MFEKKARSLPVALGAAGLLLVGGGAAYWLFTQQGWIGSSLPVGVNVLPQETLASISVSTNPNQWQELQEFGTSETQLAFQRSLTDLQNRYLTRHGFNYEADIQPWVGDEVTVAFLPMTQPPGLPAQQATVWVLPIENPARARQTLENPKFSQAGQPQRTYRGLTIQEIQGSPPYSATVIDDRLVVMASTPEAMEQVIDTYRGSDSLAETPGYKRALDTIKAGQSFARVYVNLPAAAAMAIANSGRSLSPETSARIQETQGLGSTVVLESDGIRFKSISWLKPNSKRKLPVENSAGNLAKRLPDSTLVMASGDNFQEFWQQYSQGSESQLVVPFNPQRFQASVQSATGMNFEQDFVDWMDGEFALALLPTPGQPRGAGLVLLAQTGDRRSAERSLQQLDEVMGRKFNLTVSQSKVGDQTLTTWKVPPGLPVASHGWLDRNTAFLTVGAPVESTIVPQPKTALASAALFQAATDSNLDANSGRFFVDMTRTQTLLDSSPLLPKLPPSARMFTTAIRAIGVTTAVKSERSTRYDVVVELEKAGNSQADTSFMRQ